MDNVGLVRLVRRREFSPTEVPPSHACSPCSVIRRVHVGGFLSAVQLAVISGVGVRKYYEKFGYRKRKDYQVRMPQDVADEGYGVVDVGVAEEGGGGGWPRDRRARLVSMADTARVAEGYGSGRADRARLRSTAWSALELGVIRSMPGGWWIMSELRLVVAERGFARELEASGTPGEKGTAAATSGKLARAWRAEHRQESASMGLASATRCVRGSLAPCHPRRAPLRRDHPRPVPRSRSHGTRASSPPSPCTLSDDRPHRFSRLVPARPPPLPPCLCLLVIRGPPCLQVKVLVDTQKWVAIAAAASIATAATATAIALVAARGRGGGMPGVSRR